MAQGIDSTINMLVENDLMASGKAIIVGATGGIGQAVARLLARQGMALALIGRNKDDLNLIVNDCSELGGRATSVDCDISRLESIESRVAMAIDRLEGLNYLINCAGISASAKIHESDLLASEAILSTNLRAYMYFARYALPEINRHSGGALIKIGSVNHPYSGVNTYLAASQGAEGLAEAIFEDVREYGTKVCTIKPGWVNTDLVKGDNLNSSLMIQPDDIARTVLFVLSMPDTACPSEITILPQRSPYC